MLPCSRISADDPRDLRLGSHRVRCEESLHELAVGGAGDGQQMDHHERPLALAHVTEQVFAVRVHTAHDVEDVILDLERGAEREPELRERLEVGIAPRAQQRAGAHRQDRRVRARLAQHHVEIVGGDERGDRCRSANRARSPVRPTVFSIACWNSAANRRVMRTPNRPVLSRIGRSASVASASPAFSANGIP